MPPAVAETQCLSCERWSPHSGWYAQTRSRAAANPVLLPKPKPRATGLPLIMPSICSLKIARAQWSRVGHREDALKALDLGNSLLGIHPSQYLTWTWQSSTDRHGGWPRRTDSPPLLCFDARLYPICPRINPKNWSFWHSPRTKPGVILFMTVADEGDHG